MRLYLIFIFQCKLQFSIVNYIKKYSYKIIFNGSKSEKINNILSKKVKNTKEIIILI